MAKVQRSLYEGAPGLLMDRIHEVNILLSNSKMKNGETDSWKFWKRTSDIMKYSWDYMQNLNWVLRQNHMLSTRCAWLESYTGELLTRLEKYEVVREEIIRGTFEQTVAMVNKCMELDQKDKEGPPIE